MEHIGEILRREREKKGVTLDEIASVTRIRKIYLVSIEDGDFNAQSQIFMKGFVKTYADYIGVDSNAILKKFDEATKPKEPDISESSVTEQHHPVMKKAIVTVLVLFILSGLIYLFYGRSEGTLETSGEVMADKGSSVAATETQSVQADAFQELSSERAFKQVSSLKVVPILAKTATDKSVTIAEQPSQKQTVAGSQEHILEVVATEVSWLKITLDDMEPLEVLLQPGEKATWKANQKIKLFAGNAGGVEVVFDGKSVGVLGQSGKVVSRVFQ